MLPTKYGMLNRDGYKALEDTVHTLMREIRPETRVHCNPLHYAANISWRNSQGEIAAKKVDLNLHDTIPTVVGIVVGHIIKQTPIHGDDVRWKDLPGPMREEVLAKLESAFDPLGLSIVANYREDYLSVRVIGTGTSPDLIPIKDDWTVADVQVAFFRQACWLWGQWAGRTSK